MNQSQPWAKHPWMALSPLVVFLALYLVVSLILNDFYKMPLTVAFLVSSIYAVVITRHLPLQERITRFSQGAGNRNVLLMIWIFVLAGAFAHTAKTMGAIDATVNLTLHILPDNMLLPGLFLAACFISLSVGTSVGTVVALVPMAVGVAQQTDSSVALIVAAVVGGAFFGDNLSFISDTTIIATQTQGCEMRDKFFANFRIVLPAAILVLCIYVVLGSDIQAPTALPQVEWGKVVPYITVLITAILGLNVMMVLLLGLVLAGIIGMLYGSFDIWGWLAAMALAMSFIKMVLPVFGCATISARWPFPIGAKRSTTRADKLVPGCPQSWNFSSGKSGVRCSKGIRSLTISGDLPLMLFTFTSGKYFSFSFGGRIGPSTTSPVCSPYSLI